MGDMAEYDAGEYYTGMAYNDIQQALHAAVVPSQTRRTISSLSMDELITTGRRARDRKPVYIGGVPIAETLRERLRREVDELTEALAMISAQIGRRTAQLEQLDLFPSEDPCADGDVIRFTKTFPDSDKEYTYVAHRQFDLWYVSGERAPQGVTWSYFVEWMGLGVRRIVNVQTNVNIIG